MRRTVGPAGARVVHAVLVAAGSPRAENLAALCGVVLDRTEIGVVPGVRGAGSPCELCCLVAALVLPHPSHDEPPESGSAAWLDYYRVLGWPVRLDADHVLLDPAPDHHVLSLPREHAEKPLRCLAERRSLPPLLVRGETVTMIVVATGIPYAMPPELREVEGPLPLPTSRAGWCVPPSTTDGTCRDINVVHACRAAPLTPGAARTTSARNGAMARTNIAVVGGASEPSGRG